MTEQLLLQKLISYSPEAMLIAIDGPSASGKTTVGRRVAKRLDIRFMDTGLMYRAVAAAAIEESIRPNDYNSLEKIASKIHIEFEKDNPREICIFLQGKRVKDKLHTPIIDELVARISAVREVRANLTAEQRAISEETDIVMVGRDIGTVVLPNADIKVFLTASAKIRVARRMKQLPDTSPEDISHVLENRDALDSFRTLSPLKPADDAITIETDNMTADETAEMILEIVSQASTGYKDS